MTLGFLKHRLGRILKRPPELLYAISRHWVLLAVVAGLGGLVSWARVLSEPIVYQGHAQLLIDPSDALVERLAPSGTRASGRDEFRRFMEAQKTVLASDTVLSKMLRLLESKGYQLHASSAVIDEGIATKVRSSLSSARGTLSQWLRVEEPSDQSDLQERSLYRALTVFRRRSLVESEPTGNTVRLTVFGTSRARIADELQDWMEAYRVRVGEMAKATWQTFLDERSQNYNDLVVQRSAALAKFKTQNPTASEYHVDYLTEQVARLQIRRDDLRRRSEFGDLVDVLRRPATSADDAEWRRVARDIRTLEVEIDVLREEGMEKSVKYGKLERRLAALRRSHPDETGLSAGSSEEAAERTRKGLEKLSEELTALLLEKAQVRTQLQDLRARETRHEYAVEQRDKFEQLRQESEDLMKSQNIVLIQVADEPSVATTPFEYHPVRRTAYGGVFGLLIAAVLGCFLELVHGKVRFKHDISEDFGLPVIGVFPK